MAETVATQEKAPTQSIATKKAIAQLVLQRLAASGATVRRAEEAAQHAENNLRLADERHDISLANAERAIDTLFDQINSDIQQAIQNGDLDTVQTCLEDYAAMIPELSAEVTPEPNTDKDTQQQVADQSAANLALNAHLLFGNNGYENGIELDAALLKSITVTPRYVFDYSIKPDAIAVFGAKKAQVSVNLCAEPIARQ